MRTLLSILLFLAGCVALFALSQEAGKIHDEALKQTRSGLANNGTNMVKYSDGGLHPADQSGRPYHPVGIRDMIREKPGGPWRALHSHITVTGFLTYRKVEDDSDIHLRLCDGAGVKTMDRKHCIVAEAIPALPEVAHQAHDLVIGQPVTVKGIYRFDAERAHGWAEVHPIESIEIGTVLPPLEKKP